MVYVFVLDSDGNPLMPTARCGKVRRMLNNEQAEVVSRIRSPSGSAMSRLLRKPSGW